MSWYEFGLTAMMSSGVALVVTGVGHSLNPQNWHDSCLRAFLAGCVLTGSALILGALIINGDL